MQMTIASLYARVKYCSSITTLLLQRQEIRVFGGYLRTSLPRLSAQVILPSLSKPTTEATSKGVVVEEFESVALKAVTWQKCLMLFEFWRRVFEKMLCLKRVGR